MVFGDSGLMSFLLLPSLLMFLLLQLLMGFESGLVVLWDLKTKTADCRFPGADPLRSVAWLSDGKQLVTAHGDGSIVTWSSRPSPKPVPVSTVYPHGTVGTSQLTFFPSLS